MSNITQKSTKEVIWNAFQRQLEENHRLASALEAANAQLRAVTVPSAEASMLSAERTLAGGQCECPKCQGTGIFVHADGTKGDCYTCRGKGYITQRDVRRNAVHELHRRVQQMLDEGRAQRFLTMSEINALPAAQRAGKRIVKHDEWLVLV